MDAYIDKHTQVTIKLSRNEAKILIADKKLEGEIHRSLDILPLHLTGSENGWRATGIPENVPYKEKIRYEIDIPLNGLCKILTGEVIGTDNLTVNLRKVYISLDEVF